jgi:hypothetical protein
MANLIYSTIASLDGYVADENGNFDWAAPDEEVHNFVNDLERAVVKLQVRLVVPAAPRRGLSWRGMTRSRRSPGRPADTRGSRHHRAD